ncbi:MAG: tRNA guanosine(15) transglycosylase TgtA, partial [Candidatus Thorarchaeota archaeon]
GLARLGRFTTEHGTVTTPLLMPVVHPGKSVITPKEIVSDFGFQMVITNSYIINSQDRFRKKALSDGVHGLIDFPGPIMTDSGTFQMYFHDLPEKEIDPLEIVRFQREIGSDIGTILDAFSDPGVGRTKVEEDVSVSLERARMSIDEKGEMLLAGTVQGGVYADLREKSAKELASMAMDVHPIGGVVPLMERYRYTDIVNLTLAAKKYLPLNRPVHLFGCGHPMLFAQAALLGCDFFDSASYVKFAESGRMLLPDGTVHLKDLKELPCECPVCSQTTAEALNKLGESEKETKLMKHNLYVSAAEIRRVRQAITDQKLFELAAIRARGHPRLYEALQRYLDHVDQIVELDPIGKSSSIFYTGHETVRRPEFVSFHNRLIDRYPYRKTKFAVFVPDLATRPFSDTHDILIKEIRQRSPEEILLFFITPFGIVPWELEHVHPAQQCIFPPSLDEFTTKAIESRLHDLLSIVASKEYIWIKKENAVNNIYERVSVSKRFRLVENVSDFIDGLDDKTRKSESRVKRKLDALLQVQWGIIEEPLDTQDLDIKFSRSTGKIRHVQRSKTILFTLVPTTGLLTPTYSGGLELLSGGIESRYIITMTDDAAAFVAKGKSALAKFVYTASDALRAGEEVLVVNQQGELLGVGKALLSGREMLAFDRGVAVNIRHSREHQ